MLSDDGTPTQVRCLEVGAGDPMTSFADAALVTNDVPRGDETPSLEPSADPVGGLHIGARISALAGLNEVLVSSTVRDLSVGSGHRLIDRGEHDFKGVPGTWRVFALEP